MKTIDLQATSDTPRIYFNPGEGSFEMRGRSMPEDVYEVYDPILTALRKYFENPLEETEFIFNVDFMNTATTKVMHEFFQLLKDKKEKGLKIVVMWYYQFDDDDIQELGEYFENEYKLGMDVIEC